MSSSDHVEARESAHSQIGTTGIEQNDALDNDKREENKHAASKCSSAVSKPSSDYAEGEDEEINSYGENSCIICQCGEVIVALLPCRHTCVCRDCLQKLDKCPMCRGVIESYFTITNSTGTGAEQHLEVATDDNPSNSPQWWVNVNRRLNGFLGLS